MKPRTRIKLCGLSRPEDVATAVDAGADAIGLVFYPPSPRHVAPGQAGRLLAQLPAYVTAVGLFVNPTPEQVQEVLAAAPLTMLQFHGDETPAQCAAIAQTVRLPFMRALRVRPQTTAADLLEFDRQYRACSPLFSGPLLDTWSDAYGGTGKVFDWSLIPADIARRAALSGGLNAQNVTDAVRRVRPHAVDVSSGIESAKGVKDGALMRAFIAAVRAADQAS
ncbi:MAG: phosphoribosylanthranilate isomerase [Burkholderiaceae bacterium]|nr:phosphoribosylanthranilate isomerase [Burkholderiaceae bacterium]